MLKFIKEGNIFKIEGVKAIAHGCNTFGAMGAGVALQVKNKFPELYEVYREDCLNKVFMLGDSFCWQDEDFHVFNLATQSGIGNATLEAIYDSLSMMFQQCEYYEIYDVAMPAIGAGLGGLSLESVKNTVQKCHDDHINITKNINLYFIENFKDIYLEV